MSKNHRSRICEEIAKFIASNSNSSVSDPVEPDEVERGEKAVDYQFKVGECIYVMEHTRIESYPKQIEDGRKLFDLLEPIKAGLQDAIPVGRYRLTIKALTSTQLSYKEHRKIRDKIKAWVMEKAPLLIPTDRKAASVTENPKGVPFEITLTRGVSNTPGVYIARYVPEDLEVLRLQRMKTALSEKCPKLSKAKMKADRSVLLLESNDVALGNVDEIWNALDKALRSRVDDHPDEIYLIETESEKRWYLQILKMNDQFYPNLSVTNEIDLSK